MNTPSMMKIFTRGIFPKFINCQKFTTIRPLTTLCAKSTEYQNVKLSSAVPLYQQKRGNKFGVHSNPDEQKPDDLRGIGRILTTEGAWAVRLANENGYLSWCRNTYLCSTVGVMMSSKTTYSIAVQYAVSGSFMVALLNLAAGTICYSFQLISLRQTTQMSRMATLLYISFAILHFCAWTMVVVLYLGYPEEDLAIIDLEVNELEG